MEADRYLRNGLIVTDQGTFEGGVVVKDGRVAQLVGGDAQVLAREVTDLGGRVLLPGIVDEHVHFSAMGRDFEGYQAGSMAAAAGGVTTILDMPLNDLPPTISRQILLQKRELVSTQSVVDYAHWGGLIENNLDSMQELHDEGVIGLKSFLSAVADYPRINDDLLFQGLCRTKELGTVLGVHAENEFVTSFLKKQFQSAGRKDRAAWAESRPPEQELEAIQRAIYWAKVSGGNLHIVHVSIAEGIRAIARAKVEGVNVTAETCVHYLFFDSTDHLEIGSYAKAAPPIRSRAEVEAMWDCVQRGLVDAIASDHSPFPSDVQLKGMDDVWEGGGVTGIQSILSAMVTEGIHKRALSWSQLSQLMSANPARIFGLAPKKGAILPGADADFVILDPEREWTLKPADLLSKYKHSPYVNRKYKGRIDETIVRGTTVYRNGEITAVPGFGELVRKQTK